jgi:hypothetical protein
MAPIIASRRFMFAAALSTFASVAGCSSTTNGSDAAAEAGADVTAIDVVFDESDVAFTDAPPPLDNFLPTDAPQQDASPAGDGGFFTCGPMQCDSVTQYCQVLSATSPDGGVVPDYRCDTYLVCTTDHTCACLQRNLKCSTACTMDNGGVTTVCGF